MAYIINQFFFEGINGGPILLGLPLECHNEVRRQAVPHRCHPSGESVRESREGLEGS